MVAVVQRVSRASVTVDRQMVSQIGRGVLVLLGVAKEDTIKDVNQMAEKIANLRIFEDENEKMNLSVLDIEGEALVVSQFTLLGDCSRGRRPGFERAADPVLAESLYNEFVEMLSACGVKCGTGVFQAKMAVELCNDGPVTLVIDTAAKRESVR